jgi:ribosomal protein L15E
MTEDELIEKIAKDITHDYRAELSRLRAEKAKLVEAARPFAYLWEGDFYPTKCEVKRLRAAIERIR